MRKAAAAAKAFQSIPPGMRRKAFSGRNVIKAAKVGRKWWKRWKRLPGFDAKMSVDKFDHRGEAFNRDEEAGDSVGPRNTWLFALATRPIANAIDRALFTPAVWYRREPKPGERSLDEYY